MTWVSATQFKFGFFLLNRAWFQIFVLQFFQSKSDFKDNFGSLCLCFVGQQHELKLSGFRPKFTIGKVSKKTLQNQKYSISVSGKMSNWYNFLSTIWGNFLFLAIFTLFITLESLSVYHWLKKNCEQVNRFYETALAFKYKGKTFYQLQMV